MEMDKDKYLEHPPEYWLALQQRAENLQADTLISEIAILRAKISYYESRIHELNNFMCSRLEIKL